MQNDPTIRQLHTIYALIDPRTETARYIGVTMNGLEMRFRHHLYDAQRGREFPVRRWIRKLASFGLAPYPIILEVTTDREREIFWIAEFRSQGFKLLNCNDGGGGNTNPQPETLEKLRQSHLGKKLSPEQTEKIRHAHLGKPKSPEAIRKSADARRGVKRSPEACERIGAGTRGKKRSKPTSAETRAKLSAVNKGKKRALEFGLRMSLIHKGRTMPPRTEEHRRNMSKANKGKPGNRGAAKITPDVVREIRRVRETEKLGHKALAVRFGLSVFGIGKLLRGETWSDVK